MPTIPQAISALANQSIGSTDLMFIGVPGDDRTKMVSRTYMTEAGVPLFTRTDTLVDGQPTRQALYLADTHIHCYREFSYDDWGPWYATTDNALIQPLPYSCPPEHIGVTVT